MKRDLVLMILVLLTSLNVWAQSAEGEAPPSREDCDRGATRLLPPPDPTPASGGATTPTAGDASGAGGPAPRR